MQSHDIRRTFLDFFAEKKHQIVASAPIVVKDDPTLMFTNAGMNQFKDYFLGNRAPQHTRVADTQKCLRVSGKHNDLEEVGVDTYHHTMFEMLGNWSFGDYFKREAIHWGWELLVKRLGLDPNRLYATVFSGDPDDKLDEDKEAVQIWSELLPEDRILRFDKRDNFWEMGDTGPCGPCAEIHYDLRSDADRQERPGAELVNADHPQVIEIWNLVFIQFNRDASGKLHELPAKHIDTGMGFERLCAVLQNKHSTYDTDVFTPLLDWISKESGKVYGQDRPTDIALRVVADHIRAITFTIADGQLPSNTGAGYVVRRILRRAVRYGYRYLGFDQPFLYRLLPLLAHQFGEVFPEVPQQQEFIEKVIREEENAFLKTLATGTRMFEEYLEKHQDLRELPGMFAFELYDTYGFPIDLTRLMAREQGLEVDEEGFAAELQQQKERSRAATKKQAGDWTLVYEDAPATDFLGYDLLETPVRVLRYRPVKTKKETYYQLVLDQTPFYPEGGGQVGDQGVLESEAEKLEIFDTKREGDMIVHFSKQEPKQPEATFTARVNEHSRNDAARNHTATHLMHAALRRVLGDHVQQRGSLVAPDYLRFDFSHFQKVSEEEIRQVEDMVNAKIREDIRCQEDRRVPYEEAIRRGAMALFGEKYGDQVRMITFDNRYSVELCGGTHVAATGMIGFFKIVTETSVAAGVRRIEALTGAAAYAHLQQEIETLNAIRTQLKQPKQPLQAVTKLQEQLRQTEQQLEKGRQRERLQWRDRLLAEAEDLPGGWKLIMRELPVDDPEDGKELFNMLRKEAPEGIFLLGAQMPHKAMLWFGMGERFQQETGADARQWVKAVASHIKGGGGGQPFFVSAGGKNPEGVPKALEEARSLVEAMLKEA